MKLPPSGSFCWCQGQQTTWASQVGQFYGRLLDLPGLDLCDQGVIDSGLGITFALAFSVENSSGPTSAAMSWSIEEHDEC